MALANAQSRKFDLAHYLRKVLNGKLWILVYFTSAGGHWSGHKDTTGIYFITVWNLDGMGNSVKFQFSKWND